MCVFFIVTSQVEKRLTFFVFCLNVSKKHFAQLAEMSDLHHPLVLEVIMKLQLPRHAERDVDGLGAHCQGWGDVALQRVAHHEQFAGGYR